MEPVVLAGSGVALATGLLGLIQLREHQRPSSWLRREVRFGRDVTPDAILAMLDRVAGMHRFAALAFVVEADHEGLHHFVEGHQTDLDVLRSTLQAHAANTQLLPVALPTDERRWVGGVVRLHGRLQTVRSDTPATLSAALLAALQPLGTHERVVLRWLIRPGRPATVPGARQGQAIESEDRRRLRIKNEGSVLLVRGVVAASTGPRGRAAHLLTRVTSVLRSRNTAYGQLRALPYPSALLPWLMRRRGVLFGNRYSAAELAGFLAWPLDAPTLPGLRLGTSPQRLPAATIPQRGRVLGTATWAGLERPIAQPVVGALSHSLITGPTGVGKSTLLTNLITDDLRAGRGLVLIDGKGDTAAATLARVPEHRQRGVIVLDCASAGLQPGIKLFGNADAELAADVVLGVLADLYRHEWGPLSERYLRAGLIAVALDPHGTLADVPYVFTDAAYRRRQVARLRDPLTRATFAGFEAMSPAERQQQLAAPLNKLGSLLGRPIVRTVLGQAAPQLDFHRVLRRQQIVVVSLAPARVGAPAARLIGALTVFALFQAVQARSSFGERARRPFMVYIDEPRALGDLPMPLDTLLEQARGLGVGITLAPQSLKQLPPRVQAAALTNVATRVVFRQDSDDARLLSRDLAGVTPEDLGDLAAYEAIARIGLGPGDLAPPVSLRTQRASKPISDSQALAAAAANRYGRSLDEVDAALAKRHEPVTATPVGRKRRAS